VVSVLHMSIGSCVAMYVALLAAAEWPADARAQVPPPRGAVRGVVRSTLGDRISYAVVVLEPGVPQRFTDDSGNFVFPSLAPGSYRLRARQVGFKPFDTTLVVPRDSTVVVAISLEHLVVELEEISVVARATSSDRCTAPGPPDPKVDPDFAAVFDQLRQNAERYWLLADSYPAIYRMERRFGHPDQYRNGLAVERTDTLALRTDARWHYAPGRVVTEVRGPQGPETQVNLPGLPDFADSTFLANHCFKFAGLASVEGQRYARLDFRAAEAITAPDANGSALLDTASYLIRFLQVRLTKPDLAAASLDGLEATVAFREIMPSLVLPDRISSVQGNVYRTGFVQSIEEQRTVGFTFLRALPKERP
jgi:hypothetical protein